MPQETPVDAKQNVSDYRTSQEIPPRNGRLVEENRRRVRKYYEFCHVRIC